MTQSYDFDFLLDPVDQVARRLLGCELTRDVDGEVARLRIVETEAYDATDAASHAYRGETVRNSVMFGPAGHLYVYFTYGMHYCANIVTGRKGHGSGVLLRAVEPIEGRELLRARRPRAANDYDLTNGPAKLCQALGIDFGFSGHDLKLPPLRLIVRESVPNDLVEQTTRIGISKAIDTPWRFYIKDNPYISRM